MRRSSAAAAQFADAPTHIATGHGCDGIAGHRSNDTRSPKRHVAESPVDASYTSNRRQRVGAAEVRGPRTPHRGTPSRRLGETRGSRLSGSSRSGPAFGMAGWATHEREHQHEHIAGRHPSHPAGGRNGRSEDRPNPAPVSCQPDLRQSRPADPAGRAALMARTRLTRAARAALTRSELLEAAERRFYRDGYHGTTLPRPRRGTQRAVVPAGDRVLGTRCTRPAATRPVRRPLSPSARGTGPAGGQGYRCVKYQRLSRWSRSLRLLGGGARLTRRPALRATRPTHRPARGPGLTRVLGTPA